MKDNVSSDKKLYIDLIRNIELNKCPYCNSTAQFSYVIDKSIDAKDISIYVKCPCCGAMTNKLSTRCLMFEVNRPRTYTQKEVIDGVIKCWNSGQYDERTTLSHMSYEEKVIWQIEELLKVILYGAAVPMESPEYQYAWAFKMLAEQMGLLVYDKTTIDFEKLAQDLYQSNQIKFFITAYLKEIHNEEMDIDKIRKWSYRFFQRIEEGVLEYVEVGGE